MASMYSGISRKLKSPRTTWEEKMRLARFAWISAQCVIPNKLQALLDWCTHALTGWYSKKVDFSHEVLQELWLFLNNALHSQKLHFLLDQGKIFTFRPNMAQLLLEQLPECVNDQSPLGASTLLCTFRGFFSSPVLSSIFTSNFELIVSLVSKFSSLACQEIQNSSLAECQPKQPEMNANAHSNPDRNQFFEVLHEVLSCYLSVQRRQANPNRVFTVVTNQLIEPLVLLRYLLTSQQFSNSITRIKLHQEVQKDIQVNIESILQPALFPPEHLLAYKAELLPAKEYSGKCTVGTKGPLKPVNAILSKLSGPGYCEESLHYSVKAEALTLLYKFFLSSYGKQRGNAEEEQQMLCFYFLVRLVPALDLHPNGCLTIGEEDQQGVCSSHSASPCAPGNWSQALLALKALLNQTLSADIYNVAADRIRHKEVQLNFYRSLTQILLKEAKPRIPSWYSCLMVLLNLNHLILEPDLELLLSTAWVDAKEMEPQVQQARELMVCTLLQIYAKLRQLPHLFSSLLSVICQPIQGDLRPPLFPEFVSACLKTCFLDTPPSQILDISSSVLRCIHTCILPDLVKDSEADKMEVDGIDDKKEKFDASLKLAFLINLLHVIMMNVKVLDNTSPLPLVKQCKGLMKEMEQTTKDLLNLLPTEKPEETSPERKKSRKSLNPSDTEKILEVNVETWEDKIQEAVLLLRYTLVELDTLFLSYCSTYVSVDSSLTTEREENLSLLFHLKNPISGAFFPGQLHRSSFSPMSRLILKHLTLQHMKKIVLTSTLLHDSSPIALLNKAAKFILTDLEFEVRHDEEQRWDTQLTTVNISNYNVAHWYLVVSNLPLMLSFLSEEEVCRLANVLVGSLVNGQIENVSSGYLTFSFISSQIIRNPNFAEMPSLFSATVHSLMERIIGVLQTGHQPKTGPKFLIFFQKGREDPPSEVKKEALVEDILGSSDVNGHILLTDAQTEKLLDLIQIIKQLNQDGMNSEDLASLFFIHLFLLTSTSRQPDQMSTDSLESKVDALFLSKVLMLLDHLLEGKSFLSVLKLMHGGTLLQTIVSCLLTSTRVKTTKSTDWLKTTQSFISSLVQLIISRNSSVKLNLDQFATYLSSKEMAGSSGSAPPSMSAHILLVCQTAFCQAIISNFGRSKPLDQTLTQVLMRTTESLGPTVDSIIQPKTETHIKPGGIMGKDFLFEVVTVKLRCEAAALSVEDPNKPTLIRWMLYQSFCKQILRELHVTPQPRDLLVSTFRFLSTFYVALQKMKENTLKEETEVATKEFEELFGQILQSLQRLIAASWMSSADVAELEPAVQELLDHMMEKSSPSQFNMLLIMIQDNLDIDKVRARYYKEALAVVIFTKLLICCPLPETYWEALWRIVPHILSSMMCLVRASCKDGLILEVAVPTVTAMTSLLRHGGRLISKPQHVILILEALQWLSLDNLTPPMYHSVFLAVHEGLFAIIQCHPKVISEATPPFLNIFYRQVESIMQEGQQEEDLDLDEDGDEYLWCSRLVERMYTHIAALSERFTAQSAFIVAQYVTELQKVTLRPDVKLHLTEGIYCILDLCTEQDLKFLKTSLNVGVREVFNELYSSYTHYHKTQRQGEDKYTV